MSRMDWGAVCWRARAIVLEHAPARMTLRQLFYRLVAEQTIPNKTTAYKALSRVTAKARRHGMPDGLRDFPALLDQGRTIHRRPIHGPSDEFLERAARQWSTDLTRGQSHLVVIAIEKKALVEQLRTWFEPLGFPVLALGGIPSVTILEDLANLQWEDERPGVILYAGDYDATGEWIGEHLATETAGVYEVVPVALTRGQVTEYELPVNPGKDTDPRARAFAERHGTNIQVELDALPPNTLHDLYREALDRYVEWDVHAAVVAEETATRHRLVTTITRQADE